MASYPQTHMLCPQTAMDLRPRPPLLHSPSSTLRSSCLHRVINLPCTNPQLRTNKMLLVRAATEENGNPKKEVRLESLDLMALKFGRLLGESEEKTMTKVIKRKLNPAASYVDIEKESKKDREPASLKYQISTVGQKKDGLNNRATKADVKLPSLASPPERRIGTLRNPQTSRVTAIEEDTTVSLLPKPGLGNSLRKPISKLLATESNVYKTVVCKPPASNNPQESSTNEVIEENGSERPKQNWEPINEDATNTNPSPDLPALAARPPRQKGSAGMFVSSSRPRIPRISNRTPINDSIDEPLLRKPITTLKEVSSLNQPDNEMKEKNDTHQDDRGETSTIKTQAEDTITADKGIATVNDVLEGDLIDISGRGLNKFVEKDESKGVSELEERPLLANGSSDQSHVKLLRPKIHDKLCPATSSIENKTKVPVQGHTLVQEEEHQSHSGHKSNISEHSDTASAADNKVSEVSNHSREHGDTVNRKDSTGVKTTDWSNNKQIQSTVIEAPKQTLRKPVQSSLLQPPPKNEIKASDSSWLLAKEDEEKDWATADALLKSKEQVEVKLISSSSAGFFVSFGSLVGFLPLFELNSKRGLPDFSSWAQLKGIYLSVRRGSANGNRNGTHLSSSENTGTDTQTMDIKELRKKYNEDMIKQMSAFIGGKASVIVKLVDKDTRRLKFSEKEADPDSRDLIQKKANLMAELKIGDIVTCEVKSITPIGVFVEIDGVSALIHQSEVSWNTRVDPASIISIGEVIKARVCRLDRTLQRINLSLKQMQPDPLKLTLECVVGGIERDSTFNYVETTESKSVAWPELEDLIHKLEKMDEISSVSKGRCLQSAALAPSFQVFLSSSQSDDYKLVARLGNQIQEVFVKTTLDREKMKEYIRTCTFSVA